MSNSSEEMEEETLSLEDNWERDDHTLTEEDEAYEDDYGNDYGYEPGIEEPDPEPPDPYQDDTNSVDWNRGEADEDHGGEPWHEEAEFQFDVEHGYEEQTDSDISKEDGEWCEDELNSRDQCSWNNELNHQQNYSYEPREACRYEMSEADSEIRREEEDEFAEENQNEEVECDPADPSFDEDQEEPFDTETWNGEAQSEGYHERSSEYDSERGIRV